MRVVLPENVFKRAKIVVVNRLRPLKFHDAFRHLPDVPHAPARLRLRRKMRRRRIKLPRIDGTSGRLNTKHRALVVPTILDDGITITTAFSPLGIPDENLAAAAITVVLGKRGDKERTTDDGPHDFNT